MDTIAGFVAPYLLAVASFPLLSRREEAVHTQWSILFGACLLMVLSPWLIPGGQPLPRLLAAISATLVAMKAIDAWLDVRRGSEPSFKEYLAFLANPFVLVRRCLPLEPLVSRARNLSLLISGSLGCALGVALLARLFRVDWQGWPFLLEHASKVTLLMVAIFAGLAALAALWRLLGSTAREYMDHPFAARTPADFWRRYNRNVQQFFWMDVFKPLGGLRAPIRTTLLVFALSALIHEFIFYAAIGRVQGFQSVFFALHGIAAALTVRVKPGKGWSALPWVTATLAFNLVTSVFFFASIHSVVPFYAHGLPEWLQGW